MQLNYKTISTILLTCTFISVSLGQNSFKIPNSIQKSIKKIQFVKEGYAAQPDYTIVIYCDRTIIFNAIEDNFKDKTEGDIIPFGINQDGQNIRNLEIKGIYKTQLSKKEYAKIISKVNALDKEFKQKVFKSKHLHTSIGKLTIIFGSNQVKEIYDNGLDGSESLITLYNILDNLVYKLNWE